MDFLLKKKKRDPSDENLNNKVEKYKSNLSLSDENFLKKTKKSFNLFSNEALENNIENIFSSYNIISSLFTKENKNNFQLNSNSNKEIEYNKNATNTNSNTLFNSFLTNYKIYNIKEISIFQIKINDNYIKFFPIFSKITDYEKYICYNPLIEKVPNFKIIPFGNIQNNNCVIKNYDIPLDKLEYLKEKYIKHSYTKKNAAFIEDIFKYLFEEIKINLSCINLQNSYENSLKICSDLINQINEAIEEIINEKPNNPVIYLTDSEKKDNKLEFKSNTEQNYFSINNEKKSFILNNINSKCIENNCVENNNNKTNEFNSLVTINIIDKNNNYCKDDFSNHNNKNGSGINDKLIEEKNKKEFFSCPYCSKSFSSHCGLGGHISKRHPKNQK